jgi:hypothetical protein
VGRTLRSAMERGAVSRTLPKAIVIGVSIVCLFALNSCFEPHFDFNSFWGAGRALLEGRNPYDYAVIQDILYPRATANFNYPLFIAVLVVPLGLFDLETAKNIWLTVSEVLLICSLYLVRRPVRGSSSMVLSTVACAAFVPTLIAFYDQQTSMFALFLLSVVYYGLQRGRHGLTGVALALSLIKPQTMALPLLVTLFRLRREGLVTFGITLGSMLLLAFGLMRDWPYHWWASASWITQEAGRAVPTVWGLSWFLTSGYWFGVLLALSLLAHRGSPAAGLHEALRSRPPVHPGSVQWGRQATRRVGGHVVCSVVVCCCLRQGRGHLHSADRHYSGLPAVPG